MFFLCLSWYCVLFLWIVHFWFPLQYFLTIISYHIIFNTDINGLQEFAFLKDDLLFIRCTVISTSNCCEIFCVISNCNFSFTTSFSLYRDGSRAHALFVNKTRVWKSNYIFYWKQNNNLCVKTFRLKPGGNYKNNYYLSNKLKINLFVHNNGNRMNVQIVYHLYYVLLFSFVVSACLIFLCVSFFVFFVLFCLFLCVFYHCCYFSTLSWGGGGSNSYQSFLSGEYSFSYYFHGFHFILTSKKKLYNIWKNLIPESNFLAIEHIFSQKLRNYSISCRSWIAVSTIYSRI